MTTLIECHVAGSGRCDAKCYDANGADCNCVCGGMNHSSGRQIATDRTRQVAGKLLDQIKERGGFIPEELRQVELF